MTTSGVSLRKSCGPLSGPRVDGGPSGTLYWDRTSATAQSVTCQPCRPCRSVSVTYCSMAAAKFSMFL